MTYLDEWEKTELTALKLQATSHEALKNQVAVKSKVDTNRQKSSFEKV
jgi:hypothetical protein